MNVEALGASLLNALEDSGYCFDSIFIVHSLGKPPRLTAEEHTVILAGLLVRSWGGGGFWFHPCICSFRPHPLLLDEYLEDLYGIIFITIKQGHCKVIYLEQ